MNDTEIKKTDKEKIFTIISSAIAILMVVSGYYVFAIRYRLPEVSPDELMILTCNAFEMALLAMLYIQNRISKNTSTRIGKYFGLALLVMCFKIATDQISWAVDGNPDLIWLNYLTCILTYASNGPVMVFFWIYCSQQIKMDPGKVAGITKFVVGLEIIICTLFILNPITHMFFVIDEEGYFSLTSTYWIMLIQNFVICTICIVSIIISKIDTRKKAMLSGVFFAPIFGSVIGIIFDEFVFIQYLCTTLAIFFCYVSVFIRGEDEYKEKLRELDMATAIQRGALRADFGNFGDHRIYAYMKPAREVGGDFYDFFTVGEHTIGILIADVSGKGIPAAMFMMQGLCAIRELAKKGYPINEVFEKANDLLCAHNEDEFFITAWMAYIDRQTGHVTYVNAGHNPPILKHADGTAEYLRCKPGMVLAAMEGMPYRVNEFEMGQGDTLFTYTDGIPEAQTLEDELYGEDRLLALARTAEGDPEELTITVLNGVNSFVGKAEQFDDMTIISYERE